MKDEQNRPLNELERLKKISNYAFDFARDNNDRWNAEREFIYLSSITASDAARLANMNMPSIEANLIEAHLKNVLGQIIKSKPSLVVRPANDISIPMNIKIIEGHLEHDLLHSAYKDLIPDAADDILSGGFCAIKCYADYKDQRSYEKSIFFKRATDPTRVLFDPAAEIKHCGDGRFVLEVITMNAELFEKEYPDVNITEAKYNMPIAGKGLTWFEADQERKERSVLFIDFYEKRTKRVKLYKIPDPSEDGVFKGMTKEEYNKWSKELRGQIDKNGQVLVIPKLKEQESEERAIDEIWHSQFIGNQFIKEPEKTDLMYLPWVKGDGNSKYIKGKKVSRSYQFQARDVQRAKNMTLSELLNQMTTSTRSNILIDEDALPTDKLHRDAYAEPYRSRGALTFKSYSPNGPNGMGRNLPLPIIMTPGDIKEVIFQMYQSFDATIAATLGNYQQQLGIDQRISGNAIREGKVESFASAKPILDGIDTMLNQLGLIYLSLIPHVYRTERTIPVLENGEVITLKVNQKDAQGLPIKETSMDFDPNDLTVNILAGVNLDAEKDKAFDTMMMIAQSLPMTQPFFAQQLPTLIDNCNFRGKEFLKEAAQQFIQQQNQTQAQQQQMASQQPDPNMQMVQVEQQKAQNEAAAIQSKAQTRNMEVMLKQREIEIKEQKNQAEIMRIQSKMMDDKTRIALEIKNSNNEQQREALKLQMQERDSELGVIQDLIKHGFNRGVIHGEING